MERAKNMIQKIYICIYLVSLFIFVYTNC